MSSVANHSDSLRLKLVAVKDAMRLSYDCTSYTALSTHCVHICSLRLGVPLAWLFVASQSGLRRCVLSPGWCYMHQSDLAAMGKHAFTWLAPH